LREQRAYSETLPTTASRARQQHRAGGASRRPPSGDNRPSQTWPIVNDAIPWGLVDIFDADAEAFALSYNDWSDTVASRGGLRSRIASAFRPNQAVPTHHGVS